MSLLQRHFDILEKSNGESDVEGETEEERMQREVLEDLESIGSKAEECKLHTTLELQWT